MATKDWRDYFELIGLFAIVASIVLLAFEIHQTRLAIRGEAFLSRAVIGVEADMNSWSERDENEFIIQERT